MNELYTLYYIPSIMGTYNDLVLFKISMMKMHKILEKTKDYSCIQYLYTLIGQ